MIIKVRGKQIEIVIYSYVAIQWTQVMVGKCEYQENNIFENKIKIVYSKL